MPQNQAGSRSAVSVSRAAAAPTLLSSLLLPAESTSLKRAIHVLAVLFVTALTAAAAQVSIPLPFTPVPFTLQPMIVLLGGAALGARLGMSSQVLYLALGLAGAPVFAASPLLPPGAARLLGPTGGFLMSYPFAACLAGFLAARGFDRRYVTSFVAMAAGLVVVFTCGTVWLVLLGRAAGASAPLTTALRTAVVPFLPADIVKLAFAAAILPGFWRLVGERR